MDRRNELHSNIVLNFVIAAVGLNGLAYIIYPLLSLFHLHDVGNYVSHLYRLNGSSLGVSVLIGLTLIYLSSLLFRRKKHALGIAVVVYILVILINIFSLLTHHYHHGLSLEIVLRDFVLPLVAAGGLYYYRDKFNVQSDIQGFTQTIPIILTIAVVTLIYGVIGFLIMDDRDFHQEISLFRAIHLTIDQFGLTTHTPIAYTEKAKLFLDSLSTISIGAIVYILISLFQPLRARFSDQNQNRKVAADLVEHYAESSEDFFKIWPHDKSYYFNASKKAALAYRVHRGVALVVGDPIGDNNYFNELVNSFILQCKINDWLPAFIHIGSRYRDLYEKYGLSYQKIGEEAILDIDHYLKDVSNNKYFRHINQKFTKLEFKTEVLRPPHNQAVLGQLRKISDDWLKQPGRTERGFMMGYFSDDYMQICNVMVARDAAGTIQAFINQIPPLDNIEANYDLLRQSSDSPGNMNDFLLLNFIKYLKDQHYLRLNMGLCPLSGLDSKDADIKTIDSALRFAYANGDRIYSFSGLHRFKAKYEPTWESRYIAYAGGIRGFSKGFRGLNAAMKVRNTK